MPFYKLPNENVVCVKLHKVPYSNVRYVNTNLGVANVYVCDVDGSQIYNKGEPVCVDIYGDWTVELKIEKDETQTNAATMSHTGKMIWVLSMADISEGGGDVVPAELFATQKLAQERADHYAASNEFWGCIDYSIDEAEVKEQ